MEELKKLKLKTEAWHKEEIKRIGQFYEVIALGVMVELNTPKINVVIKSL